MLLLVSVKQVTNFMVAVKEPVVVFETKDGGFLFGNYLFFHNDRKSSTPYMSVEMRSGLYPQSLINFPYNYSLRALAHVIYETLKIPSIVIRTLSTGVC